MIIKCSIVLHSLIFIAGSSLPSLFREVIKYIENTDTMTAIRMEEKSLKQEPFWSTMLQVLYTRQRFGLARHVQTLAKHVQSAAVTHV